jgi:peptidyl-prolyl cis-trans isomerase C
LNFFLTPEVSVPDPSEEECLRYYQNNLIKFVSSPLFEVSHILYLAPPEDKDLFLEAQQRAEKTLEILALSPERFAKIAEEEIPPCSSRGMWVVI